MSPSLQGRLLAMDGHDGMGALSLLAWQTYIDHLARKEEALKLRKEAYGAADDEKYKGLEHLYYSQDWFARTLAGHDVAVDILAQNIPGYLHNRYRYNVYVRRAGAAEAS